MFFDHVVMYVFHHALRVTVSRAYKALMTRDPAERHPRRDVASPRPTDDATVPNATVPNATGPNATCQPRAASEKTGTKCPSSALGSGGPPAEDRRVAAAAPRAVEPRRPAYASTAVQTHRQQRPIAEVVPMIGTSLRITRTAVDAMSMAELVALEQQVNRALYCLRYHGESVVSDKYMSWVEGRTRVELAIIRLKDEMNRART